MMGGCLAEGISGFRYSIEVFARMSSTPRDVLVGSVEVSGI